MSQNDILVMEWHQVVLETPFARAFVSDIYIPIWKYSYILIKSFCLSLFSPVLNLFCCVNLDLGKGLCNETRMVVLNVRRKVLQYRIISKNRRFRDLEARWCWFQGLGYHLIQRYYLCHSRDFNSQSGQPLLWPSTSLKDSQWSMWGLICRHQCSSIDNFMWPFQDVLHFWTSQYFFQSRAKRVKGYLM